jgi:3-dehydroquinate dehydratase / shikimate dehydrogenase
MLVFVIAETTIESALEEIASIDRIEHAIEWRIDYLISIDSHKLRVAFARIEAPLIITCRHQKDGGLFKDNEITRLNILKQLVCEHIDYIDLEHYVPLHELASIKQQHPDLKIIRSYHNFNETPEDLPALLQSMQASTVNYYKVVTKAQSSIDAIRLMIFIKQNQSVFGHALGKEMAYTRYLGPVLECQFSYCKTKEVMTTFFIPTLDNFKQHRFFNINKDTSIYALIGNPIQQSPGAQFHNTSFTKRNINAIYVLIPLKQRHTAEFFKGLESLPIQGLSVTRPLKSAVLPYLKPTALRAINTLQRSHKGWHSTNTDGKACVDLLSRTQQLKGKSVLILGAGGTAKGILQALPVDQMTIFIFNRTLSKAQLLALTTNEATVIANIDELKNPLDIVIGTLPPEAYQTVNLKPLVDLLHTESRVMDVNYHEKTPPLQIISEQQGCEFTSGIEFFEIQAQYQQQEWFSSSMQLIS